MKRKSGQVHFYALGVGLDSGEEPTDLTWQTFKDICFLIRFHVDWIAKNSLRSLIAILRNEPGSVAGVLKSPSAITIGKGFLHKKWEHRGR